MTYHEGKFVLANNILVLNMPGWSKNQKIFIGAIINSLNYGGYNNYPRLETLKKDYIYLPTINNTIDFDFMESLISELEEERISELEEERISELTAYLKVSGMDNYVLSPAEQKAISNFSKVEWNEYNLEKLFGKSTRGKRLKSADRIPGNLPFITAGEAEEGFSDYIANDVTIFEKNTTTIDMFGSAKYRNYNYGGDDHIAIVHTENLKKYSAIFVTTAIHRSSHNGQFSYSKNFYAKDADELNIMLPTINGKPNYEYMDIFISAIHKLVIKDVVDYANKKVEYTKNVVNNKLNKSNLLVAESKENYENN